MKGVGDQRCTGDTLNLGLGHARTQLTDQRLVKVIALADRDAVEAGQRRFAAGGQQQKQDAGGAQGMLKHGSRVQVA